MFDKISRQKQSASKCFYFYNESSVASFTSAFIVSSCIKEFLLKMSDLRRQIKNVSQINSLNNCSLVSDRLSIFEVNVSESDDEDSVSHNRRRSSERKFHKYFGEDAQRDTGSFPSNNCCNDIVCKYECPCASHNDRSRTNSQKIKSVNLMHSLNSNFHRYTNLGIVDGEWPPVPRNVSFRPTLRSRELETYDHVYGIVNRIRDSATSMSSISSGSRANSPANSKISDEDEKNVDKASPSASKYCVIQ